MTDQELLDLADKAQAWRTRPLFAPADLEEMLAGINEIAAAFGPIVAELREARRRLAELEPPKPAW